MVHRTPTRDKIKQLLVKARELDNALVSLSRQYGTATIDLKNRQRQLEEDKNRILPKF